MTLKSLLFIGLFLVSPSLFSQDKLELFHENGNPKSIEYFDENGNQVNEASYFFDNKQLHYKEQYKDNYKVGTVTVYYRNGKINKIIKYSKKGTRRTETTFNTSGTKRSIEKFVGYKKEGKLTYFYSNTGNISREEHYKDNKKHGKSIFLNKDGNPWKIHNYKEGKQDGLNIEYYPDGKTKKEELNYNKGILKGLCKHYYKNGIVKYVLEYGDSDSKYGLGKLLNVIELNDINGNPLDKGTLKDGNGIYHEYDDKGNIRRTFDVVDGVKKYRRN
ncbi:toxin-antitoxin system YwqK family antitoxin [Psychroserpens sp. XS_ASV72]|uniref:toxin-antitoxin system YwqK family antitoxin n=1 Tax=Psychroserpens sp. XS_ASV72 TaxID=3241293 RepID=UPI0035182997